MTLEEYFGDWMKVIDKSELVKVMNNVATEYNRTTVFPTKEDVFRAFRLCSLQDLKIVFLGYDPYPDKYLNNPRATGILFGNREYIDDADISPSLKIIKEAAINFEINHNGIIFDNTLESWANQGILMINSALTCAANKTGSHTMLWRPFISSFLKNLSLYNTGIVYVLFGEQAKSFKPYISNNNIVIEEKHPAYYARTNKRMSSELFININKLMRDKYKETIKFYKELN